MRKVDPLLLQTGYDIPFPEARLTIHQPNLREISMIGEFNFHIGTRFLMFDKDKMLDAQDKFNLEDKNNFDIFMSVMRDKQRAEHKVNALMILSLLFPNAQISVGKTQIDIIVGETASSINAKNFDIFQDIIGQMFCLINEEEVEKQYNPADALAAAIANKLKKAKEKVRSTKEQIDLENTSIYGRFVSILAVGLSKDKNDLCGYTIPQIKEEMKRFQLYQNFNMYVKMKLAGAENVDEVEDWMGNIVV